MCKGKNRAFCRDHRYTRRQVVTTAGMGVAGASLAGTLGTAPWAQTARARQDQTQVTWWTEPDDLEAKESLVIEPFQAENPDIQIVMEPISGEDRDRVIATALQAGAGPDIVPSSGPAHAGTLSQAGLLLSLDDYATEYSWDEKLLPWALETGRLGGSLYLLPNEFECTIMYYGEKQFADNGWSPPTNRQEFEDLATEAAGMGLIPVAAGTGDCGLCTNWLVTIFFNHYAGPDAVYQALTGEIQFSDPIFVEAIELLNQYMQAGWIGGSVERYFSTSFDTVHSQLAEGSALMAMEGTWFLTALNDFFGPEAGNDNAWAWAQNPSFRDEIAYPLFPIGIGSTLSIAADSEAPDASAEFLNWYYSDPARVAQRIAEGGSRFTLAIPYEESDFPETIDPRVMSLVTTLSAATASGDFGYVAWTFWPPKTHVFLHDEIQRVFTNELSPADYCAGMAELFTEELEAGVVPAAITRDAG
jgi:raffinose/stachyose/melibiose transport system substrate-binding protein